MTLYTVRSATAEIEWPAVVGGQTALLLAVLQQLDQSQWWPAETIALHQARQLAQLLDHARRTVPHYADRLAALDIAPDRPIAAEAWARVPLLTRRDAQEAGTRLHSTDVPKSHGKVLHDATSGSTGMPIAVLKTQTSELFRQAFTVRDHLWHGRDLSGTLAVIIREHSGRATYPHGLRQTSWGVPTSIAYATGPCIVLDIHCTLAEQAECLQREHPTHLLTYPSNLAALARHCLEHSVRLPSLAGISTLGEVVGADLRALVRRAFGVSIQDVYSSVDGGCMALQCPDCDHYHVQSEGVLLEVLDEEGRACAPGEIGRIVVTPLHNFAMPLIRYVIGDYAEVGEACSCGRGLPVLRRILGRTRNMLRLPNGQLRWATLESDQFARVAAIVQCQVVQRSVERLEARLVARRPLTAAEAAELRMLICEGLGHRFLVEITYHDEIQRGADRKFEEFVSEVA